MRKLVEAGRVQVGFGDQRFIEDAEARVAFRRAMSAEARWRPPAQGEGSGRVRDANLPVLASSGRGRCAPGGRSRRLTLA